VKTADFSFGQPSLDEVFLALTGHLAGGGTAESPEQMAEEKAS
jgi:hypothetical protein